MIHKLLKIENVGTFVKVEFNTPNWNGEFKNEVNPKVWTKNFGVHFTVVPRLFSTISETVGGQNG